MIFIYVLNLNGSQLFLQIVFLNKLGSHKKMVEKHWPKIRKYLRQTFLSRLSPDKRVFAAP